jgi:hypothetical protein
VPTVLRAELVVVAALAGAGSISLGFTLGLPHLPRDFVWSRALPVFEADIDLSRLAAVASRPSL